MNYEILAAHGVDWRAGLHRCMGDEAFYRNFLMMFMKDESFLRAQEAFDAADDQALHAAAHELKGICGNANLTRLYGAATALCDALREGGGGRERLFAGMKDAYATTRAGIAEALRG